MTTKQMTQNRHGFTFSATLAAGMAVSVMAASVLATVGAITDDIAVSVAADQFDEVYSKARALAVRSGRTAEIRIEGDRVWVEVDTTAAGTGERTRVGPVVNPAFGLVTLEANTTALCFDSSGMGHARGRCSVAGGVIEFSRGNSVKAVATTVTGLIPR